MAAKAKRGTSPWVWVGCGCVLLVVLVLGGIGGSIFFGIDYFKDYVADMSDPQARDQAALELMGATSMPEGFRAQAFLRMPFVFRMAMLTDGEAPSAVSGDSFSAQVDSLENLALSNAQLGRNLLLFIAARGASDQTLEEMIGGQRHRSSGSSTHIDLGLEIIEDEELGRGEFLRGDLTAHYRTYRGQLELARGSDLEGTFASIRVACPAGDRDLLWFQSDLRDSAVEAEVKAEVEAEAVSADMATADAADAADAADVAAEVVEAAEAAETAIEPTPVEARHGSPDNPAAIERMLGHFDLCAAS